MKKIILAFCLIFFVNSARAEKVENSFVPGVSDLPVPINFYQEEEESSVFDTDDGRLIESKFVGRGKKLEIIEFYDKTLKALGWRKKAMLNYVREKEELKINIKEIEEDENFNNMELFFSISPLKK